MNYSVREDFCPALGDLRALGEGDVICLFRDATEREDWPKVWDAIGAAFLRGAVLLRGGSE